MYCPHTARGKVAKRLKEDDTLRTRVVRLIGTFQDGSYATETARRLTSEVASVPPKRKAASAKAPERNGHLEQSELEIAVFIMARACRVPPEEIAKRLGWSETEVFAAIGRITCEEKGDLLLKLVGTVPTS